jgi:hypothetical protein
MHGLLLEPVAALRPRPVRNVRDLFESLRACDAVSKFDALKALQARPEVALRFGTLAGAGCHRSTAA